MLVLLTLPGQVLAQSWTEYTNRADGFRVDFPGQPTVTQTTRRSRSAPARAARLCPPPRPTPGNRRPY